MILLSDTNWWYGDEWYSRGDERVATGSGRYGITGGQTIVPMVLTGLAREKKADNSSRNEYYVCVVERANIIN